MKNNIYFIIVLYIFIGALLKQANGDNMNKKINKVYLYLFKEKEWKQEGSIIAEKQAEAWNRTILSKNVDLSNKEKIEFQHAGITSYDAVRTVYKVGNIVIDIRQTISLWCMIVNKNDFIKDNSNNDMSKRITEIAKKYFQGFNGYKFIYSGNINGLNIYNISCDFKKKIISWLDTFCVIQSDSKIAFICIKRDKYPSAFIPNLNPQDNKKWFSKLRKTKRKKP